MITTIHRLSAAACFVAMSAASFAADTVKSVDTKAPDPRLERFVNSGVTVTTTPFIGTFSQQGSASILYNLPSINEDLVLLQQRELLYKHLKEHDLTLTHPVIGISGALEASATHSSSYSLDPRAGNGSVNLSTAELDVATLINQWATAYFSLDYDSSPVSSGSRAENSKLYLKRGFLTIGDLSRTPFYVTAGQMYAPFGLYRSTMLTTPVTKSMGRVLQRMMLVGYDDGDFAGSLYGYHSSLSGKNTVPFNEGGINLLLKHQFKDLKIRVSVGAITNMADSQGMMGNGLSSTAYNDSNIAQFTGFSSLGTETLSHSVPGLAFDFLADWPHWSVIAGYVGTVGNFSASDLTFNGQGASPKAAHLELDYIWRWYHKPITVGLSYGHTWQALGLNLPENSISLIVNTSPWKNIAVGVEYRHRINYSSGTTAIGLTSDGTLAGVEDVSSGGTQDGVTLQVGVYF